MPKLACRACGRQIYTTASIDALFAEERRCPRCGAFLDRDRRETERRQAVRRVNPSHNPGPPTGYTERRHIERRTVRRRSAEAGGFTRR